jgi:DNA-binding beta-propeller fold protein YncE
MKYVADPGAGAVFVFDRSNTLAAIWGREEEISPVDIVIKGDNCYVLDTITSQVLVLDKTTGEEIDRIGKQGEELGQLQYVTCLAVDDEENVYVSDKINGYITKLNRDGIFQQQIGQQGDALPHFLRVKGVDIDREGRIWCVDAGSGYIKAYNPEGRLLVAFARMGKGQGSTSMPAIVRIDYDHIDLFQQFAVEGAKLELIIIVTNQYGPSKVNVYGLGTFPSVSKPSKALPEETAE